MARVICLGGCGVVGSIATKTLAAFPDFSEVVIGDINAQKGQQLIQTNPAKISFQKIDVNDFDHLVDVLKEFDVVVNTIGPFYQYGPLVLKATIQAGKKYVDVSDDVDATQLALEMNSEAKAAEVSAIIGLGSSPGVTNILAKFAATDLLDEVISIDLYHAHGGEPTEGPGVIFHRIHAMTTDIPVFVDGDFKTVSFFSEEGQSLEEEVEFEKVGTYRVHPYPHPETITLPQFIPGVKRVTNKGTVLPPEYFYLIVNLVKNGLNDETPLNVKGKKIKPIDFAIAYIIHTRERILKETNFGTQRGCVKIVVKGKKAGASHTIIFSLASEDQALGEGTGMPVAFGAIMLQRGLINEIGVLPPEACVDPMEFLGILQEHLSLETASGGASPLTIESIDVNGNIEKITL
ncbi:saccharopine dehydrogenase [Candidatus Heimdallarchaeota archaeon B3_Heim]|nr:MAG: saccharopine dehydrogenase [Candidatus Heimdallarchaeota archaeon B3_Heim]